MKRLLFNWRDCFKGIIVLSVGVGLIYFAFPNRHFYTPVFAWVCFVPLLLLVYQRLSKVAIFFISWLFFQIFFGLLFWFTQDFIPERLHIVGDFDGTSIVIFLFPIIYAVVLTLITGVFKNYYGNGLVGIVQICIWMSFEYLIMEKVVGFPLSLAITQFQVAPVVQLASVTGIYGVSGLIFLVNVSIARMLFFLKERPKVGTSIRSALGVFALLAGVWIWGEWRLNALSDTGLPAYKVSLIQPHLTLKHGVLASINTHYFNWYSQRLFEMTTDAQKNFQPDIMIWPETALVHKTPLSKDFLEFKAFAEQLGGTLILGAKYIDRPDHPDEKTYNATYLYQGGRLKGVSYKTTLVPIFESAVIQAGSKKKMLPDIDTYLTVGPLLCFEILFPDLSRRLSIDGATALICLSNNSYLGKSNWPLLHVAYAPFRASESGVPVVFANTTGSSLVASHLGEVQLLSPFYQASVSHAWISPATIETFYSRYPLAWWTATMVFLGAFFGYFLLLHIIFKGGVAPKEIKKLA